MKDDLFTLNLEEYPIGKGVIENVDFPSFYGLQQVQAPVYIYRASKEISPCVVVTACMHGDEINGMRIAQSIMKSKIKLLKGTLIIFPVINIYGFLNKVRYLPDRKDINRCFPGNEKGSFGTRFANFVFENITKYGDVFIDLHSGGAGRFNIPQIRCDLTSNLAKELIEEISIPLVINSSLRDGSLRSSINDLNKPCIVFEGGEGLRFDETITKYGINLIRSVLGHLEMIKRKKVISKEKVIIHKTKWYRAAEGGIFLNKIKPGKIVTQGEVLGEIRTITGDLISKIRMEKDGVVIGMGKSSIVMSGDALYNLGYTDVSDIDDDEMLDYFDLD